MEECVNEGGEAPVDQQPEPQQEEEGECVAVQEEVKEEPKEESVCVVVDSVITVDTVVEQDGKVEEESYEEVNVKQTFTAEEPMPYGPDESLQNGKVHKLSPNCVIWVASSRMVFTLLSNKFLLPVRDDYVSIVCFMNTGPVIIKNNLAKPKS